jgi:hypothetical protein
LVRSAIGEVRGLRILEVACGRGGFVCILACNAARASGLVFSMADLKIEK